VSLYAYCSLLPVTLTDSSGLSWVGCAVDIGLLVANLVGIYLAFQSCAVANLTCVCGVITSACGALSSILAVINDCTSYSLPAWATQTVDVLKIACTGATYACDGIAKAICKNVIVIPRWFCNGPSGYPRGSINMSSLLVDDSGLDGRLANGSLVQR